jgi:hypothetical protein
MGTGTGYGKTILIGDQFVLEEVPAIVSAIAYETEAVVERRDGKGRDSKGWILEDCRREVPGYKESKKIQQIESIDRILRVMGIDAEAGRGESPIPAENRKQAGERRRCKRFPAGL